MEKDEIFEEDMSDEDTLFCPLFNEEISFGLCVDISYVLCGDVYPGDVPEVKDWTAARATCPTCESLKRYDEEPEADQ